MEGSGTRPAFQIPQCDSCDKPALVEQAYSGRILCGKHLAKSVRKKISKELRQQLHLKKGEHTTILVAVSGGKDSAVLLDSLVDLLGQRRDVTIVAGTVDEGIEGYRPPSIDCAKTLCDRLGIAHEVVSYPELSFVEIDEVVKRLPMVIEKDNNAPRMACAYCGVFRRQGINHLAQRVGADVIALGHNLDDMAQTVLMNVTNGDLERTLRLAPHTSTPVDGLAPRIVPLRWVPEQEIHLYALHRDLPLHHEECPNARGALRWRHREMVAKMEADVPGTRHGLVKMADQVKLLRDQVVELGGQQRRPAAPTACPRCGSMTSQDQCKACDMRDLLGVEE
ncbi:MAG: TIGR00269 family protein [Candidatus Poseidonia sp.]|nr:TIGR00269 family protein [Poseidonia sp.]MBL6747764.1 TIGR00269 family protein [Poseidonia sp.]MBL6806280.1 TIGR00269 family protein [Poseidonia sp.]MBL6886346.1 TIGR00269 family protein [Poseidonia sp.]MBL6892737.1 TIGR00269 family protein [Poseidonia sp.]